MRNRNHVVFCIAALGVWGCALSAAAQQPWPIETERLAQRLAQATVTLRMIGPRAEPASDSADAPLAEPAASAAHQADPDPSSKAAASNKAVSVVTGVAVKPRLLLTFLRPVAGHQIRATLPDGQQATATPLVVDEYSGLCLLRLAGAELAPLPLAERAPNVGMPVMTGAAAGIELPTMSLGIVSALDRSFAVTDLPPLLQCDVRTTESSAGAALIDPQGALVGIVVAAGADDQKGFTFALPLSHVRRLFRAIPPDETLVVLRQQRPTVGLRLAPGPAEESVQIEHVAPAGPAAKAGLQAGDLVLQAEGRHVRSAYQVVSQLLKKQPGDEFLLRISRQGVARDVRLTLDSAAPVQSATAASGARDNPQGDRVVVGPRVTAQSSSGRIAVAGSGEGKFLAHEPGAEQDPADETTAPRLPRDEATLLRKQLDAFAQVIERMQAELARRDEAQQTTNELIESLTAEIARLRRQLENKQADQ